MKLSIIVPIYNVERYLRKCIDSVLAQTFTDFECILVDDGSPDNCSAICDEYAKKDSRIRVIHKENGGLSDARNAGLDIAQGEYIGFIDSDDYIHERMYEILVEKAISTDVDIVACGVYNVAENGETLGKWPNLSNDKVYKKKDFIDNFHPDVRRDIMTAVWNKIYKREIFSTLRFPFGKYYEDAYIQLDIWNQCDMIAVVKDTLYYYLIRQEGIMRQKFSAKKMHLIDCAYRQYVFFVKQDNPVQINYTLSVYLTNYLMTYYAVSLREKSYKKEFLHYKKQFGGLLIKCLRNPIICRLKKITLLISIPFPYLGYKICQKYFPECIHEFMR